MSGWRKLWFDKALRDSASIRGSYSNARWDAGDFLFIHCTYLKWFYTSCDFYSCSERKLFCLTLLKCNACVFGGGEGRGKSPLLFSWANELCSSSYTFPAVNNRDTLRPHGTDNAFVRSISYVSDSSGGNGTILCLSCPLLPLPFGCVTLRKFYAAPNGMGKRRGLKLKFFKVPHIKRFCEERDSKS